MIVEVQNRPGLRCDSCHEVPPTWFSARCPSACGFLLMACSRCATRAAVEEGLAQHVRLCPGLGAAQNMKKMADGLAGIVAKHGARAPESITRQGARLGAEMGRRRGTRGEQVGAVAGAALGALGEHVLGKPELEGPVRLARGIFGVVTAAVDALKK